MRRFYKSVDIRATDDAFEIALDGKPLRTPGRRLLTLPSETLAEAIANEWREQGETLDPAGMTLTKLANTALDRIEPDPGPVIEELCRYAQTDLICYRADTPPELVEEQRKQWDPLIDWAEAELGARLTTTVGVIPKEQSPQVVEAVRAALSAQSSFSLAGIRAAASVASSVVIALALDAGRLDGSTAFGVSQIDETHQISQWGDDVEAAKRRAALRQDLLAAERFLRLGKG